VSDERLDELVRQHGWSGKLVRAVTREMGWPRGVNGAPSEWHVAYRGELGDQLERIASR
jgi:hypothetical protein